MRFEEMEYYLEDEDFIDKKIPCEKNILINLSKYTLNIVFVVITILAFTVNQINQLLTGPQIINLVSGFILLITTFPSVILGVVMIHDLYGIRKCNRCLYKSNCIYKRISPYGANCWKYKKEKGSVKK